MKFLDENGLVYDKPTKNGNYNISQKKPEVVSSRIDQTPLSNFPNNFRIDHPRLTKQSFHNKHWDRHFRKIHPWYPFEPYTKFTKSKQTWQTPTKDSILETLQDIFFYLKSEVVNKQRTVDTLMPISEKIATGPSNAQVKLTSLEEREIQNTDITINLINHTNLS